MKKAIQNIIATIVLVLLADFLMVMIHEFSHTILAWATGHLSSPFDVFFTTKGLFSIDNRIDYDMIIQQGYHITAAVIAIVPNIVNPVIFVICAWFLYSPKLQDKPYLYYFIFWFMIANFGQFYSYMYRAFEIYGDADVVVRALKISPYWLFIPSILIIVFGAYNILKHQVLKLYKIMKAIKPWHQIVLLIVVLLVLFGYYGGIVYSIKHQRYTFLIYPILLIVLFFLICFPKNRWVQNKLKNL